MKRRGREDEYDVLDDDDNDDDDDDDDDDGNDKEANLTPRGKVNYEKLTFFQYTKKLSRFWEQISMFHCALTRG